MPVNRVTQLFRRFALLAVLAWFAVEPALEPAMAQAPMLPPVSGPPPARYLGDAEHPYRTEGDVEFASGIAAPQPPNIPPRRRVRATRERHGRHHASAGRHGKASRHAAHGSKRGSGHAKKASGGKRRKR